MNQKIKEIYTELVSVLKSKNPNPSKHQHDYGGNKDKKLHLRAPTIRSIAKKSTKENKALSTKEWVKLLHLLSKGKFDEEKQLIGKILESNKELKEKINLQEVEKILSEMKGWSQVDSLCQSVFEAEDMLGRFEEWEKTIKKLSRSESPNKKRASLVLLTAPVRQSDDKRFSNLSFRLIDNLKKEEDKLVTKAISWLLREMIKNHRKEVSVYLKKNKNALPATAVRETTKKLKTGTKT